MKERPSIGVGGPGLIHLNHFGCLVRDAYNEIPYLVGSAARGKQWRDVDVRLILPDEQFENLFGKIRPFWMSAHYGLLTAALSTLGERYTGLPVDFQFQPESHANEHYGEQVRVPLGLWFTANESEDD